MQKDYIPKTKEVIYQDSSIFSYSIDTMLLNAYAKKQGVVADVGCGTGLLALKAAKETNVQVVHAFDIQEKAIELLQLSAKENRLEEKIICHLGDINELSFPKASLDTIISNPPFFISSLKGEKEGVNKAKHILSEKDWFASISPWLKFHGNLYTIVDTARLYSFLQAIEDVGMAVKSIKFVHKKIDKEAMRALIWAKKGAKSQLRIDPPLTLYNEDNTYTEEVGKIYGKI